MRTLALALVISLGIAVAWLVRSGRPISEVAAPRSLAAHAGAVAGVALGASGEGERRADVAALAPESAPGGERRAEGTAIVRVLLEPGLEPLEGLEVALTTRELAGEARIAVTDGEGRARWSLEAPATLVFAHVATGPRNAASRPWLRERRVAAGESVELDVRVQAGERLSGSVVDGDGRPVPGARVRVWAGGDWGRRQPDLLVPAADDGRFELARVPVEFTLDAVADGWTSHLGLRGRLDPGARAEGLRVELAREAWLEGSVVDPLGRPVEGCTVSVDASGESSSRDTTHVGGVLAFLAVRQSSSTGPDGRFRLGPVPERPWNVRATHPAHPLVDKPIAPGEPDQVIQLPPGASVAGQVLTHRGEPAAGARLRVRVGDDISRQAVADEQGRYAFQGLRGGSGVLAVHARGERLHARELELAEGAALRADVRLEAPRRIAGRVVEADGTPAAGALLHLSGGEVLDMGARYEEPSTLEWVFGLQTTTADEQGRFAFEDLPPRTYMLSAASPAAPSERMKVRARAGREEVVVRLDAREMRRVVLHGRVVEAETGAPIQRFEVSPLRGDTREHLDGRGIAVEHPQGEFRLTGFEPGFFGVSVRASGRATWRSGTLELAEGEHRFDVALYEPRTVELEVVDARGAPVPGETYLTFHSGERRLHVEVGSGSTDSLSLARGRGVAQGLPAERLQVRVHLPERSKPEELELDLRARPRGPWRLVVDVARPVGLEVLAVAVPPGAETPRFGSGQEAAWVQALTWVASGALSLPESEISLAFRSREGRVMAEASLMPEERKWATRWSAGLQSGEATDDWPRLHLQVSSDVVEVQVMAAGYRTQTLAFDGRVANGGLPPVLVLRRE